MNNNWGNRGHASVTNERNPRMSSFFVAFRSLNLPKSDLKSRLSYLRGKQIGQFVELWTR